MFFAWFLILAFLHHSGFPAQETAKGASTGSISLVATPTWSNLSVTENSGFTVDLQDAGIPSQQGQRTSYIDQKKLERSNDKPRQCTMALWTLQADGQIFANILSQLWQLVGGCYRQLLRPPAKRWEGALGSELGMECMGRTCNTQTKCNESQKFVSTQERQRPRERQGKGQRQERCRTASAAFPLQLSNCLDIADTAGADSISSNATDSADLIDTYGWTPTGLGLDCSYPEGIPRREFNAPRSQGSIGQIRTGSDTTGHTGPPSCHGQFRPCTKSCARADGITRSSQAEVDAIPPGFPEAMERPNDSVRCSAGKLCTSHCQSKGGHESSSSQHPSAQCSSSRETSTRAVGHSEGRIGIPSGHGSRGKSSEEKAARSHGTVCNQSMWKHERGADRSRSSPRFGRRTKGKQKTSFSLASWWSVIWIGSSSFCQEYCTSADLVVSLGSVSSCLRNVRRGPRNQGRVRFSGVEAYPSVYDRVGAASSEVRPYDCLFDCNHCGVLPSDWHINEFQAALAATSLSYSVTFNNSFENMSDDAKWYFSDDKPYPTGVSCRNRIPQTDPPAVEDLLQVEVSVVENDYPKPPSWTEWYRSTTSTTTNPELDELSLMQNTAIGKQAAEPDSSCMLPEDQIAQGVVDRLLQMQHTETGPQIASHGLAENGVGLRTFHLIPVTHDNLRIKLREVWKEYSDSQLRVHLVWPQPQEPDGSEICHVIVEFRLYGQQLYHNSEPTLVETIIWTPFGQSDTQRMASYHLKRLHHADIVSRFRDLCKRAQYICIVRVAGLRLPLDHTRTIVAGTLVQMYAYPPRFLESPEYSDYVYNMPGFLADANTFLGEFVQVAIQWRFHLLLPEAYHGFLETPVAVANVASIAAVAESAFAQWNLQLPGALAYSGVQYPGDTTQNFIAFDPEDEGVPCMVHIRRGDSIEFEVPHSVAAMLPLTCTVRDIVSAIDALWLFDLNDAAITVSDGTLLLYADDRFRTRVGTSYTILVESETKDAVSTLQVISTQSR